MRIIEDLREFAPGIPKKLVTILINPNFHSVLLFRLSNFCYRVHFSLIAKVIWYINRIIFDVDLDYRADLAGGFVLVHGLGTVIGRNVKSKGPLKVYQHVTIGGGNGKQGSLGDNGQRLLMPQFEGKCTIYAGATVVGGIRIKDGVVIKAGNIVHSDIIDVNE